MSFVLGVAAAFAAGLAVRHYAPKAWVSFIDWLTQKGL